VAEIGGKGAVAFGDGNPPPSTKLEFRKDSSFYRGDNYFAAGGAMNRTASARTNAPASERRCGKRGTAMRSGANDRTAAAIHVSQGIAVT
ncbi:hypothetical protein, partial [Burkholderia aenigmatica]|uniref:hypothetical protein n=1 Tax=Burkholderia aenigmatica TaxID=2015348 RepID=UPI00264FA829